MNRAKTPDELRDEFMDACRAVADYWATAPLDDDRDTVAGRICGALHSWLCIIDGVSGDMPAFRLTADPHPDDKVYHQAEGEDWIEPGTDITALGYFHDRLYYGSWVKYRGPHFKEDAASD